MPKAITNTSPLLYLYRIGKIGVFPQIFEEVLVAPAVVAEFAEGRAKGYDVPTPQSYGWLQIMSPQFTPSEWLASDLGKGELETMSLALEHPGRVVVLDDALARRIAQAAGLEVWGTLRVLLEAKHQGLIPQMAPVVDALRKSGMWISEEIRLRILVLAGERKGGQTAAFPE
jgi:predicted nucleic acid-binding protein